MTDELESLAVRIREGIANRGCYYVSAPAEMAQLGSTGRALEFARKNGWMLVCHLGGENFEFFESVPSPHQAIF